MLLCNVRKSAKCFIIVGCSSRGGGFTIQLVEGWEMAGYGTVAP